MYSVTPCEIHTNALHQNEYENNSPIFCGTGNITLKESNSKVGRGNSVHGVTPYTSIIQVHNFVKSQRIVFKPGIQEADGTDIQQPEY